MMTLKDLKKRVPVADEKKVILRKKELLNAVVVDLIFEDVATTVEITKTDLICELPVFFRLNQVSLYLRLKIILFFRLFSI